MTRFFKNQLIMLNLFHIPHDLFKDEKINVLLGQIAFIYDMKV